MHSFFIRNVRARALLEYFWISAVVSVFAIRIFLYLTGYPQLGGAGFHIAHMLWGGLLMAGALLCMLSFLNREIKTAGAIIGGIGFGTFIDELGKFITHDNNYFFQPTILLLYLIFVGLFFLAKQIEVLFPLDKREYLINSLELFKEVAEQDLDANEKKDALSYLLKAGADQELPGLLLQTLRKTDALPVKKAPLLVEWTKKVEFWYKQLVRNRLFGKTIILVFILGSLDNLLLLFYPKFDFITRLEWGVAISTFISLVFIVQGAVFFRKKQRLAAFRSLKMATLVSLFLVQLFLFYIEQLSAAVDLIGSLISLQVLQILIQQEKVLRAQAST